MDSITKDFPAVVRRGSFCTKCGQPKPRMDSSPCFRCVSRNVREAEQAAIRVAGEYVRRRSRQARIKQEAKQAPMIGEGI